MVHFKNRPQPKNPLNRPLFGQKALPPFLPALRSSCSKRVLPVEATGGECRIRLVLFLVSWVGRGARVQSIFTFPVNDLLPTFSDKDLI